MGIITKPYTFASGRVVDGTQVNANFDALIAGIGDQTTKVVGPVSFTDNAIVRADGATGKLVQNSSVIIDDAGNVGIGTTTPGAKLEVTDSIANPYGTLGRYQNLWLYSEAFGSSGGVGEFNNWVKATVTENFIASPTGEITGAKITSTHALCNINSRIAATPNQTYTGSVWLKEGTSNHSRIWFSGGLNGGLAQQNIVSLDVVLTPIWTRYTLACTCPPSGINQLEMAFQEYEVGTYFYAWGAQIVEGIESLPYVRTNGVAIAAASGLFINTNGFMPPRMTTAQRDAIVSPIEGMVIFNITTHVLNFYYTSWAAV